MDPAIAGALIGGSFAIVGVAASIWATSRTLRANREEARAERLWDKRAALYETMIKTLSEMRKAETDDAIDVASRALDDYETRALAYASDDVLNKYDRVRFLAGGHLGKEPRDASLDALKRALRFELQQVSAYGRLRGWLRVRRLGMMAWEQDTRLKLPS